MAKIKVKTNRGAAKRFKVTATGKIKRWRSSLLALKSAKKSIPLSNSKILATF